MSTKTELVSIVNNTPGLIKVDFLEDEKHDTSIDQNHSREFYFPPIPWCGSQKDFDAKGLMIYTENQNFAVWQWNSNGEDKVRWSPKGEWREPTVSSQIPGYSDVGARICIVVNPDGLKAYKLDWNRGPA
jgi:hypothetical protein